MELTTINIISDIPNKVIRNRLYNLWNSDNLHIIIINNEIWYRELYVTLPNISIPDYMMKYLVKYMLKRYNLKYLYDLRR